MTNQILMDAAERDLKGLLAQLSLGDTVTLADESGKPVALLVSLQSTATHVQGGAESKTSELTKDIVIAATKHDLGKKNEAVAANVGNVSEEVDNWVEQMKALAARVSASWQGEKSGLEELAEMRR